MLGVIFPEKLLENGFHNVEQNPDNFFQMTLE